MSALTTAEKSRLEELCGIVRRGMQTFVEVGNALMEIRESGLYRERCATFEAFVQIEFGMKRAHAYRQIAAAETVALLSPTGDIPAGLTEGAIRPLTTLPPEQRAEAFEEAKEVAKFEGKKRPTASHVSAAVRLRSKERKAKHESAQEIADALTKNKAPEDSPLRPAEGTSTEPECHPANKEEPEQASPEVGAPTGATATPQDTPADEGVEDSEHSLIREVLASLPVRLNPPTNADVRGLSKEDVDRLLSAGRWCQMVAARWSTLNAQEAA